MKEFSSFKDLESNLILISGCVPLPVPEIKGQKIIPHERLPARHSSAEHARAGQLHTGHSSGRPSSGERQADDRSKTHHKTHQASHHKREFRPILFNWQKHNEIKNSVMQEINKGQFKEAVSLLNQLVDMFLGYIKALSHEGFHKKNQGDLNGSLRIYEILNQFTLKCVPVFLQRSLCYFRIRDMEACLKDLEFVLKYKPNNITAHQLFAKIESKRKNYTKAIESIESILKLSPKNFKWLYAKAHYLLKAGEFLQSVHTYREALLLDPKNPNTLYYLGKNYFEKSDHQRAKDILEKSLKKMKYILEYFHGKKKDYQTWLAMGETSKKLNLCLEENLMLVGDIHKILFQMQAAVENYSELIAFRPLFLEGHLKRAEVWSELQNWEHAVQDLSFYLSKDPDNIAVHIKRGKIRQILKLYKDSIEDFDFVLQKEPFHVPVYYKRAESYLNLQDFKRAEMDICKYLEFKPKDPQALYFKAKLHHMNKQLPFRNESLKEALLADEKSICVFMKKCKDGGRDISTLFSAYCQVHAHLSQTLRECFNGEGSEAEWVLGLKDSGVGIFEFFVKKCELGLLCDVPTILSDIQMLCSVFKDREEPVLLLSTWNYNKGYPEKAVKILDKFITDHKSESSPVFFKKGAYLYQEQDYVQALKDIKKAIKFAPHSWQCCFMEGLVYDAMKAQESMMLSYKKAFSMHPSHQEYSFEGWLQWQKAQPVQG